MSRLKKTAGIPPSEPLILLVDDELKYRDELGHVLAFEGAGVLKARSGLHALEELRTEPGIAVVVTEYWMVGMDGIQLLNEVRRLYPDKGRILLMGTPDAEIVLEAIEHKVLTKSMSPGLIRRVILREAFRRG